MKTPHIPYDQNSLEQNDAPALAISEWQELNDADGSLSTSHELTWQRLEEFERRVGDRRVREIFSEWAASPAESVLVLVERGKIISTEVLG